MLVAAAVAVASRGARGRASSGPSSCGPGAVTGGVCVPYISLARMRQGSGLYAAFTGAAMALRVADLAPLVRRHLAPAAMAPGEALLAALPADADQLFGAHAAWTHPQQQVGPRRGRHNMRAHRLCLLTSYPLWGAPCNYDDGQIDAATRALATAEAHAQHELDHLQAR